MKVNSKLVDMYKRDIIKPSKLEQEWTSWYDCYTVNPLLSYMTVQDIKYLNSLAVSPKMNCDVKEKYYRMGELMKDRGFEIIGGGTNRRAYSCVYDPRVLITVATDQVGFTSNLREVYNQNIIKPFCDKVFEVAPSGTVSLQEQVVPNKVPEDFKRYAPDIFDILYFKLRNNNIGMEDIGTRSFKNWGYRNGFGPVMLDYPTMYVLDPSKRLCRNIVNGRMCGGTLDYDEGFNVIVCSECGRTHFARSLALPDGDNYDRLMQAIGYQQKRSQKESIRMRINILNANGEVEETREVNSKSKYVDQSKGKKRVKPVINLNEPQQKKQETRRIKFIVVEAGTMDADGNMHEITNENEYEETAPEQPPVVNEEPVVVNDNIEIDGAPIEIVIPPEQLSDTVTLFNVDAKQTINEELISEAVKNSFRKIDETITELETGKENPTPMDKLNTIQKTLVNTKEVVSKEEAFGLFKMISAYTIIPSSEEQTIDDSNIETFDSTLIVKHLLNKIYPEDCNMCYDEQFYDIVNIIGNAKVFFEGLIGFCKETLTQINIDNRRDGDTIEYTIDMLDYIIVTDIIKKTLDDFCYHVRFNKNGSYNLNNLYGIISINMPSIARIRSTINLKRNVYKSFQSSTVTILTIDKSYVKIVNVLVEKGEDYIAPEFQKDNKETAQTIQEPIEVESVEINEETEETIQTIQEPNEVECEENKEEDTEEVQENKETVEETVSGSVDSGNDSNNTDDSDVSDDDTDDTEHNEPVEQPDFKKVILTDQTLLYDADTTTGKEISRKQKYKFNNKKNKHHRYK